MTNKPGVEALRALLAFADASGVGKAANQLGLSQPDVTKKLARFKRRDAFGAALIRKKPGAARELELTDEGLAVLPAIRQLVRQYDHLLEYLAERRSAPQVVRIATGSSAAQHFLPEALALLRTSLEQVQIEVSVARGTERILGTVDGRYDLAIVSHSPSQVRDLVIERRGERHLPALTKLLTQTFCVVASKRTEAGRELAAMPEDRAVPVTSLTKWELIGPDRRSGIRRQLEDRLSSSPGLYFVIEGGGWPAVKQFAKQGIGVGILPQATISPADAKQLVVRRLADDFAVSHYLLRRSDNDSPNIQSVQQALIESAKA